MYLESGFYASSNVSANNFMFVLSEYERECKFCPPAVFYLLCGDEWQMIHGQGSCLRPMRSRTEGPVATLARALELARTARNNLRQITDGVRIFLRGGTYPQSKSVVLSDADGRPGAPLLISAYKRRRFGSLAGRTL